MTRSQPVVILDDLPENIQTTILEAFERDDEQAFKNFFQNGTITPMIHWNYYGMTGAFVALLKGKQKIFYMFMQFGYVPSYGSKYCGVNILTLAIAQKNYELAINLLDCGYTLQCSDGLELRRIIFSRQNCLVGCVNYDVDQVENWIMTTDIPSCLERIHHNWRNILFGKE